MDKSTNPAPLVISFVLFETRAKTTIKIKNDSITIYQLFIIKLEKMILHQFFFPVSFFPRIFFYLFSRIFFLVVVQNVGCGVLYDVRVL